MLYCYKPIVILEGIRANFNSYCMPKALAFDTCILYELAGVLSSWCKLPPMPVFYLALCHKYVSRLQFGPFGFTFISSLAFSAAFVPLLVSTGSLV